MSHKDEGNRVTPDNITELRANEIFVFGSNLEGRHLGGAARAALKWGAVMGQGVGLQGQTYAIPTMFSDACHIEPFVREFIMFAKTNPNKTFLVTEIGCGIAGHKVEKIAPMFSEVTSIVNIYLPKRFWEILNC